jgi:hypothetical protein
LGFGGGGHAGALIPQGDYPELDFDEGPADESDMAEYGFPCPLYGFSVPGYNRRMEGSRHA